MSAQFSFRRVAWITPDFPPDRGGVSDHSTEMVNALRAAGHEVLVCARPHERGFAHLNHELAAYRPDLVIVAYTPLGYAPRTFGIAPNFALWSARLRRRLHCPCILLAHEVAMPVSHHFRRRELKLAALGAVQTAQFATLVASFDAVLFSNVGTQALWAERCLGWGDRFHTIRICSNIPYNPRPGPAAALTAAGYVVPTPTVLFFGTGHQSVLFDYVEEAFRELLRVEPAAGLVIVGMTPEKLREVRPSLAALGDRVHALGYVEAELVSLWLRVAVLVLAPLIEGVSARKGTVMAALQHGQAVVTTRGRQTRDDIAWQEICILSPLDRKRFADLAVRALQDPEWRSSIGSAARAEYEAHASAKVTAARILDYAQFARTGLGGDQTHP